MALYQTLSNRLRKLSIMDFMMMKWIYFIFGILIATVYPPLFYLSIWAYLILTAVAALPLLLFTASFSGSWKEKAKQYLANNNPSNQVLTLISCLSFGIAVAIFFPILTSFKWFTYLIIMAILVLKPASKMLFSDTQK